MIQRIENLKMKNLNIVIRGYTSLSNIQFGYAVARATALHLATEALAKRTDTPYRLPKMTCDEIISLPEISHQPTQRENFAVLVGRRFGANPRSNDN